MARDTVGEVITDIALRHPSKITWWLSFTAASALVGLFAVAVLFLLWEGVGIWGNNVPVTWALDIVSYDWWIGVSTGGLLVSATSLLLGVQWRGALNRITETAALIAAIAAGLYPILHLGRPWFFYWNLPYPNTMALWPQFRSPLYWDAIDIISFLLICLSFWYVGLIPDLAALRDRAFTRARTNQGSKLRAQLYGIAALGWRGSALHWQRWTHAYRTIAILAVLVVISLQAAAAVMFAGTVEPGWHDTLLPVSFIAAAIFAGVGVMAVVCVLLRGIFALQLLIDDRHLDMIARLLLGLGLVNLYCNAQEMFTTALAGDRFDVAVLERRLGGAHAWSFWAILLCALLPVHLFWRTGLRRNPRLLCAIGLLVAAGMYADHFMVIVVTLQQDFLPAAAHPYSMDVWGIATFLGTIGVFAMLLLLFLRYLPVISILELRRLRADAHG